jgi:hypothetical protein
MRSLHAPFSSIWHNTQKSLNSRFWRGPASNGWHSCLVIILGLTSIFFSRASLTASSATQLHSEPVVMPLTKSAQARSTRRITPDEIVLFRRDPTTLVNKQFMFNAGDELYEIMEASFAAGGWSYKVRFEGCVDSVNFSIDTMFEMLEESCSVTV